jgi:hypothetical protein
MQDISHLITDSIIGTSFLERSNIKLGIGS